MIEPSVYGSLGELLGDALLQYKSETALIEADRHRENARLTYLDFKRESERFARLLEGSGLGPDDRVAIVMSNQSKWLLSAYAILVRGGVVVPIDYKLSAEEQCALLAHSKAKALVVEYPLWRRMGDAELHRTAVEFVWVSETPQECSIDPALRWEAEATGAPLAVKRTREDLAAIVYSSGTGGRPKGCMLTHGNYLHQLSTLLELFPMEVQDRYFSILPTNHAIDFMCGFLGPLCCGATVIHQRTLRPEFILQTMRRYGVTHMALVPLILEAFERAIRTRVQEASSVKQSALSVLQGVNAALTRARPKAGLSRFLLRSVHEAFGGRLKLLFCGGAFVDRARAQFFYDLGIPVVIGYGLTEACTVVTVHDLKPFRADSVGRPMRGVRVELRAVDPETGIGEVWVSGPTVMRGYLDDEGQTREVLQDGWLRTGDLGAFDASGHLRLVGRSKNMIVTAGGKNIYPEDVENAFEGVPCDELAIFASGYLWPGTSLTEEALVAVVRGAADERLHTTMRERNRSLPDFKRIGGIVAWAEPFPRTASMKLKREALAAALTERLSRESVQPL